MEEPGKRTFAPPAPEGAYLDAAFLCVLFAVPFFYLLFPAFLPSASNILPIRLLVPPLAVLLITSSLVFFSSPELPAGEKFGLPSRTGSFPLKMVFSYLLFMYVFLLLVSWAVRTLANRFGFSLPEQDVVQLLASSGLGEKALIILSAVLIAPVAEEFVFRHIFFSSTAYWIGGGPAAVLTAFLFSALHGNLLQGPSLFFMSLILQAAYQRAGKLTVPILIHMLFNTVSVILILLMTS